MSNTPGKHEIKELQETATLGTAHLLRRGLMRKDIAPLCIYQLNAYLPDNKNKHLKVQTIQNCK